MPPYTVVCYTPGCGRAAEFKVAARWSDGATAELKTYGLSCAKCVGGWFQRARDRQAACRLVAGESLEVPCVYRLGRGRRDQQLERVPDLETASSGDPPGSTLTPCPPR